MLRNRNPRALLQLMSWVLILFIISGLAQGKESAVRFGVTPAFLHDQQEILEIWKDYLQEKLGKPVQFVRRDSYWETIELIRSNQIDFAWICVYPYLYLQDKVRLLAVPRYQGKPAYRSYLIVSADDETTRGYRDLRNKIFAYADPLSNTGYLSPRFEIRQQGDDPTYFFRKTFFTWSHRKVIEAVASGLADAGAVDSYVWESLQKIDPKLTDRTRIVWRSPEYGFPPLIAHADTVDEGDFQKMQGLLLSMASDPEGSRLLRSLNIDDFSIQDSNLYESVADMMRVLGEYPVR